MRKMKDSGIAWIGEIPEEWEVKRLRYIFDFNTGLTITRAELLEEGIPCINYGEIHSKYGFDFDILRDDLKCTDIKFLENMQSAIIKNGDFIFCDTSEDIKGSGNCVYVSNSNNQYILAGSHTVIARPIIDINSRYLAYLFSTQAWRVQIRSVVYGIKVFSITQNILKSSVAILPPMEIQKQICDYLDKKCSEIDSVIKANETTNEKLKEYRQSTIYETVTKGLNKNAPMKDSGIKWIGEIPEGWETWRIKHLALNNLQYGANEAGIDFNENLPRYIRITDISQDNKLKDEDKLSLSIEKAEKYILNDGDILFARSGATAGKSFYYTEQYGYSCYAGYLIRLTVNSSLIDSRLIYYYTLTSSYEEWIKQIFIQATIQNVSADKYNNLIIPFSENKEEQLNIINYLEKKCAEIDSVISANEITIEKLKEYRQSVIYEAVTGKTEI